MADDLHQEEALGKSYDGRLMRRLVAYVRPYRGAMVLAVGLIVLGPDVWGKVLAVAPKGEPPTPPIFPLENPAIVSIPAAFLAGIVVSLVTPDPAAQAKFEDEKLRTYAGLGAD